MPTIGSRNNFLFAACLVIIAVLPAVDCVSAQEQSPIPPALADPAAKFRARAAVQRVGNLPLYFEENRGQNDSRVKFLSRGRGYTLFLTEDEAVLALQKKGGQEVQKSGGPKVSKSRDTTVLRMKLPWANPVRISGEEQLPGKIFYASGKETGPLQGNATYQRVKYAQVYPGIELEYYGNEKQLEFDFVVAPHADPKQIRLSFSGAEKITLTKDGELSLRVSGEEVRLKKPAIYQERNGQRAEIAGGYVLTGKGKREAIFDLAPYDPSLPLVIDPAIDYATYLGTSSPEQITSVFLNAAGEVYVLGNTDNLVSFPQTGTPAQGVQGCFISKFDPTLSTLLSSIVLGNFICAAADVGPAGIYLFGASASPNFYLFGSLRIVNELPNGTVSVTALPDVLHLGGVTSVGASPVFLRVDSAGNVYILSRISEIYRDPSLVGTGLYTYLCPPPLTCPNLTPPLPSGFLTTPVRTQNNFALLKYNAQGSLVYGTNIYGTTLPLGNMPANFATGLAIDNAGNAYVAGITGYTDFPTTANALHPQYVQNCPLTNGMCHLSFLMQIDTTQSGAASLAYSSFLDEIGVQGSFWNGVTLDSAGAVYVAGGTGPFWWWQQSPTFADPFWLLTPKDFARGGGYTNDGQGVFVTKMDLSQPPSQQVVFTSTFGGGQNVRVPWRLGISLRPTGEILVYGDYEDDPCTTFSGTPLPVCFGFVFLDPALPPPPAPQQGEFLSVSFLAELSSAGDQLLFSTPLGTETQCCQGNWPYVALTPSGDFFVGLHTTEAGRATAGAFQQSILGSEADILLFSLVRSPVATPQSITTDIYQPVDIVLAGSDPQGDPLTFAIVTQPANGVLCCPGSEPNVNYTPNPGFTGTDSFTFTVSDGRSTSAPATVTIKVKGIADVWVTVDAYPSTVPVGSEVQLQANIYNSGPNDATNVMFAGLNTLGAFTSMQIIPSQGTCTGSPGTSIDCSLGTIASGSFASVNIFVIPTQAIFPSPSSNSVSVGMPATVSTDDTDPDLTNNIFNGTFDVTSNTQDTTPPVVTPPADIVIAATEAGGARGNIPQSPDSQALANFLAGATATDNVDPNPSQQLPQMVNCANNSTVLGPANNTALFPLGQTCVQFRFTDATGNVGSAVAHVWVNPPIGGSASTSGVPYSATDSNNIPQPVSLRFSNLTQSGLITAIPVGNPPNPPSGFAFLGTVYDISTTVLFTGNVEVCFVVLNPPAPANAQIVHYVNSVPVPLSLGPNSSPTQICGLTASLSPFAAVAPLNHPPSVSAGASQTVEATSAAGASVTLSGSGSDPDSDPLTFAWSGPCGNASGPSATLTCPLGTSTMTLTVDDGRGGSATDAVLIAVHDTTPPAISVPANITVQATGPLTPVSYPAASASDLVDGVVAVNCTPASGAGFPVGANSVTCSASDAHGNSASGSFLIAITDTTPPVLTLPANITTTATSAAGAVVNFAATANDLVDGAVAVNCTLASGATFPVGTTSVNCSATDAHGNSASGSFSVNVSLGTPRIGGAIAGKGRDSTGSYYVDLRLTNTGDGHARNVRIATLTFRTLSGTGTVSYNAALSGGLPLMVGGLDVGAATTVRLYLNVPATVTRFSVTEGGTLENVQGTPANFSLAQSVIP